MINKFNEKLGRLSVRSLIIVRHIGWSMVFKLGSIIANFMLVPLTITYLGAENYGLWLTLSSVLTWFVLFDIGLGNGLRNKFAEARALGNDEEARAFVSTAYIAIGIIGTTLVFAMWLANNIINWTTIFNSSNNKAEELKLLMPIVFGFFGVQLVVKLITSIYQADQHHSIQEIIQFFTQSCTLLAIWLLLQMENSSLITYGSIYMALPVLILLLLNGVGFSGAYRRYRPSIAYFNKQHLSQIAGLGLRFFIIQIAAVVLFSTDNFIITQLFGPAEVVPYNIAFKYFSVITLCYGILVNPFWSSITDAYSKKDIAWISRSVGTIQKLWLIVPLGVFVMILISDSFYRLWLGDKVNIPFALTLSMATYVLILTFGMIYIQFINGTGKIKLQLLVSVVVMFLNIPLSIFFARNLGLGSSGVILGTSVCLAGPLIIWRMQYLKLMNGTAQGVWNK